jgi:hypothetical protein
VKRGLLDIFSRYAHEKGEVSYVQSARNTRGGGWFTFPGPEEKMAVIYLEYAEDKPQFDTFEKVDAFLQSESAQSVDMPYYSVRRPRDFLLPSYARVNLIL